MELEVRSEIMLEKALEEEAITKKVGVELKM